MELNQEHTPMHFSHVAEGPPDPIFGMIGKFAADPRPHKINLMVGTYHNEQLQKELMPSVRKAKEIILPQDMLADYLPMEGFAPFHEAIGRLLFGSERWDAQKARICAVQTVGGTGALRIGGDFLRQESGPNIVVGAPSWANHPATFLRSLLQVQRIPAYDHVKHGFDITRFLEELNILAPNTAVLFHMSCHNPTGSDPTPEDWRAISRVCKERKLLPFFDAAYQGFGLGVEEDAYAVRSFLDDGHEMLIAYSCSKNFSMYCQRVGALFVVTENARVSDHVKSQLRRLLRTSISNPPAHGARIVAEVLQHHEAPWRRELEGMRMRISNARQALLAQLPSSFAFARNHKGMFSYLDLEAAQVQALIDQHAVYVLEHGRINVAGLNAANTGRVAEAIRAVSGA